MQVKSSLARIGNKSCKQLDNLCLRGSGSRRPERQATDKKISGLMYEDELGKLVARSVTTG